jgi:hypothetical protein
MHRLLARVLVGVVGISPVAAVALSVPATTADAAVLAAKHTKASGANGCSKLTTAEVQALVVDPITKVTVKTLTAATFGTGTKKQKVGQTCTYAVTDTSDAMTITVITGSFAPKVYAGDVKSLVHPVKLSGVGTKAVRSPVDSNGAADTTAISALKGTTYCYVDPGDGEVPGVATLEEAAGYTNDIGDKAYAEMAAALGTLCNRVFGSGNTTPALTTLISQGKAAKAAAGTTATSTRTSTATTSLTTSPTLPS